VSLVHPLSGAEISILTIGWVAVWAILARFHPQKQFWHDAWAGTRLVHYQGPASPKKQAAPSSAP